MSINYISGMKIIKDDSLVVYDGFDVVIRSWKERLFTKPWQPLKKTKKVHKHVPDSRILQTKTALIMHPSIADELIKHINHDN